MSNHHDTHVLLRGILHNPDDYPDPDTFNPARYLTSDGVLDPSVRDPRTACFGFGRRICPGRHIADASIFATVSTLLATVDVVRAKDAQGKEVIPKLELKSGFPLRPKPYPWSVRPRSQHVTEMLEAALAVS
jgi:cytochrome P450